MIRNDIIIFLLSIIFVQGEIQLPDIIFCQIFLVEIVFLTDLNYFLCLFEKEWEKILIDYLGQRNGFAFDEFLKPASSMVVAIECIFKNL